MILALLSVAVFVAILILILSMSILYLYSSKVGDLASKVVVITGCDSGFGRAFLDKFNGAGKYSRESNV